MSEINPNTGLPFYDKLNIRDEDIFMAYSIYIFKGKHMAVNKILVKNPRVLNFVEKYPNLFLKQIIKHLLTNFETPYLLNETLYNRKIFFDWLLKNVLFHVLIKLNVSTLFGIEIYIEKIYNEILLVYSLNALDFPKFIDKNFMDSFFENYDPFFEIRHKFAEYTPKLNARESLCSWAEIYNNCENSKVKFKMIKISEEYAKSFPENDLFKHKIFDSYSSITTIHYIEKNINFEDEDIIATQDIVNIQADSLLDYNISDLALNFPRCDCLRSFCDGCSDCPSCREKKCKIICREKLIFNCHDIFNFEPKEQIKTEIDANEYFISLRRKKRGRQACKQPALISNTNEHISIRLEESLLKDNDDNLNQNILTNLNYMLNYTNSSLLNFSINSS